MLRIREVLDQASFACSVISAKHGSGLPMNEVCGSERASNWAMRSPRTDPTAGMRSDLPSGTITFLFTDVEGSTRLLQDLGEATYAGELAEHRRVIREACDAQGGVEVDTQGDAFFVAFSSGQRALAAAAGITDGLSTGPIRVRIGIHTGAAHLSSEGYVGEDVHRAARIAAAGHGGQVLVSEQTAELLGSTDTLVSLGAHRLKDFEGPVRLYQLGDGSFPALKTIANTNLPTPASSFLGRDNELNEADALLRQTRLLTVHGPGGQGKTRFALELASRAREERFADYSDGVFSCFLASLRDPSLVLGTICQTLSVREEAGRSALEALSSHLKGKKLLLLLDNLEHLLACAGELSELLSTCPELTLLVTSRELLRINGELPYALPPLADEESVSLFCERALAEPSEPIRVLCERLDGLPLAIELAAARMTLLSPEQLLERLSQRLDLLKGRRDADPRQQTLRATIEWSYDLLSPEEQVLFARLSVFAGGCTLEAAEEVSEAELDTLESLVDKNLLRLNEGRFWMLETIRAYAGEALEGAGEEDDLVRRHAGWILRLAEESEDRLMGVDSGPWFDRLETEFDNVRAAVDWALVVDRILVLRLVSALWYFLAHHGHIAEPEQWLDKAWSDDTAVDVRLRALRAASAIANTTYDLPRLVDTSQRRLELARASGDRLHEAGALHMLASAAQYDGDHVRARHLFKEELALHREAGDELKASGVLGSLGLISHQEGDLQHARSLLEESLAVSQSLGSESDVAWALIGLGGVLADQGESDEARHHLRAALTITSRLGDLKDLFDVVLEISFLSIDERRAREAVVLAGVVDSLSETLRRPIHWSRARWLAMLDRGRAELGPSEFESSFSYGRSLERDEAVEYALRCLD